MRHRGMFLLSLITWLIILSIARCQNLCPARCLCHFNELPRTVECSKQGLQIFPDNISDLVRIFAMSNNFFCFFILHIFHYKVTTDLLHLIA